MKGAPNPNEDATIHELNKKENKRAKNKLLCE